MSPAARVVAHIAVPHLLLIFSTIRYHNNYSSRGSLFVRFLELEYCSSLIRHFERDHSERMVCLREFDSKYFHSIDRVQYVCVHVECTQLTVGSNLQTKAVVILCLVQQCFFLLISQYKQWPIRFAGFPDLSFPALWEK